MSVKRLGDILREGAEGQVGESSGRLESTSESYWPLISQVILSNFSLEQSYETAIRFFKGNKANFAAIDGSLDQRLLGGLAVFWAGSSASTGTLTYRPHSQPDVQYDTGFVEKGYGVASCVPIYVDLIPEIDPQSTFSASGNQVTVTRPTTQESAVDNSTIASWMMLFSELYLAYQIARSGDFRIILLDRSLSGTHSSLIYDTSKRPLWRQCSLLGMRIGDIVVDNQLLAYGRYRLYDSGCGLPPRGDYLRYAIIALLEASSGPLTMSEIAKELQLNSEGRLKRLKTYLQKDLEEGYLLQSNERYSLHPAYRSAWPSIQNLVDLLGHRFFSSTNGNPLRTDDGQQAKWMTTLDLAFLSLFTFNLLVQECIQNDILLVGITKDTTARDFITHVVPVCIREGVWKREVPPAATTDRMLLQATSVFHFQKVQVPWASIEYDTAFQTIIPDLKQRTGYVSGAIKNRIIIEQRFVKCYIQLDQSESDPQFRSNVLFIDRLYYDHLEKAPTLTVKHEYTAVEDVNPILWPSRNAPNRIQELVLVTLKAMTQRSLPEVFGHNKPLFVADKLAKAQRDRAAQVVSTTGHWLVTNPKLRRFSFYLQTFRERRSGIEHARSRA